MGNSYFKFKQFTITQEKSAMKVGTDGVLLGAYVKCKKGVSNILDVGSGTGLISLMLAQRCCGEIDAVEIDSSAFNEAVYNAQNSKWADKIKIHHSSFQNYALTSRKKYDTIVSNPPFFSNSLKNCDSKKSLARHNDQLPMDDLIKYSAKLLNKQGSIWIISPYENLKELEKEAIKNKLFITEVVKIKATPQKTINRVIVCFSEQQDIVKESELIIEENGRHQYSNKYKELTKDYYLNM